MLSTRGGIEGRADHVGALPGLWRRGWAGPILATAPTLEIARTVLADGLSLEGTPEAEVEAFVRWMAGQSRALPYDEETRPGPAGAPSIALREAGHIWAAPAWRSRAPAAG